MKKPNPLALLTFFGVLAVLLYILITNVWGIFTVLEKEEDPLVTRIKQEIILPFCETNGDLSEDQLTLYFSDDFISFYRDVEVTNWKTFERHTPLTAAKEKYQYLFTQYIDFKDCESYLKNMRIKSLEEYVPEFESDIGFADYIFDYNPSKNVSIALFIKYDKDGNLRIKSVARSASVYLKK
jgi:hypothetical protein